MKSTTRHPGWLGWSLALTAAWLSLHSPTQATQFEPYGGPGGQHFTVLCPPGYHLVGLEGRVGKWVDKMAPICGSWNPERQGFVNRIPLNWIGTSEGGAPAAAGCPQGYAVNRWTFWFTVGETLRPKFVSTIHLVCEAAAANRGHFEFDFGNTALGYKSAGGGAFSPPSRPRPSGTNTCPRSELAIGMEGRSGRFIDALALICGPSPTKLQFEGSLSQAGQATTRQRPGKPSGPVGNPDPSVQAKWMPNYPTILSPMPNRQFFALSVVPIKLAPPSSVAATNYEVIIQRKDGSGDWITQHTFPMGTGEAQSPYGYQGFGAGGSGPTKLLPLLTSPGSWRLQARVLQPTPMAWSPWVEFVVIPPLTKEAVTQTPSQGFGAGSALIRPRRVEDEAVAPKEQSLPEAK